MLDRADPRPAAAINLGLHHPAANCFPTETELLRHRLCGRRLRRIVLLMFLHQPDRPSPQLGVDLLRHIAILPNSERNGMEPVTIHGKVSSTYRNDCRPGTGTASPSCQPATGTRWSSMNRNCTHPDSRSHPDQSRGSCQLLSNP